MKNQKLINVFISAMLAFAMPLIANAENTKAPALSIASPISDLMANAKAKAVVEKYLPELIKSDNFAMIESMSIQDLSSFPQANLDEAKLKAIQTELSQVK